MVEVGVVVVSVSFSGRLKLKLDVVFVSVSFSGRLKLKLEVVSVSFSGRLKLSCVGIFFRKVEVGVGVVSVSF